MEDFKKAIARCEARLYRLKAAAAIQQQVNAVKEQVFQKKYDEVLNKHILNLFRKSGEELNSSHEHRTVKIINGEIVRMRLDFLHGQADGIKVVFERENIAMYIWFAPQVHTSKIIFKIISAGKGIDFAASYNLSEIHQSFLLELIGEKLKQLT